MTELCRILKKPNLKSEFEGNWKSLWIPKLKRTILICQNKDICKKFPNLENDLDADTCGEPVQLRIMTALHTCDAIIKCHHCS